MMPPRKGKSRRRVKDWRRSYLAGEMVEDSASAPQKHSARELKLPAWRLESPHENLEQLPKAEGVVVAMVPGGAIVRSGGRDLLCGIAKTFRAPEGFSHLAVGDTVTIALAGAPAPGADALDRLRADAMVLSRGPRRTALCRPQPRSGKHRDAHGTRAAEKVIAANADVLLIVVSTRQPAYNPKLIDRYLIVAERGELKPLLAVNKIDLAPPDEQALADCRALGLETFACSAITGEGLGALVAALAGKATVLAGASGVGKSALVNAMVPGARAAVREVRMRDQRGRHTTSAATVYDLPGGGILVDTPGVRELGMDMEAAVLPWYFPEFEPFSPRCKFRDCSHTHEPDCAVLAAVREGGIPARRYESYLRILETLER